MLNALKRVAEGAALAAAQQVVNETVQAVKGYAGLRREVADLRARVEALEAARGKKARAAGG